MVSRVWTAMAGEGDQRDTIIVDFNFVYADGILPCEWSVVVRSKSYPAPAQELLDLHRADVASIEVTFPSGLEVSGALYLRDLGRGWVVWTDDLSYHFKGQVQQRFEGGLVAIGAEDPPTSPTPAPPPEEIALGAKSR